MGKAVMRTILDGEGRYSWTVGVLNQSRPRSPATRGAASLQGFAATIEFPRHERGVQRCCLASRNRVRLCLPHSPLPANLLTSPPRSSGNDPLLSYAVRFLIVYLADVSNLHNPNLWPCIFPPFASTQLPPPHCMHNFVPDLCNQPFFLLLNTCIPYFMTFATNQSTKQLPHISLSCF